MGVLPPVIKVKDVKFSKLQGHAFITSTGDIIGDMWKLFPYFETAISRHFFRKGLVELHCVGDCLKKCALISFCFGV